MQAIPLSSLHISPAIQSSNRRPTFQNILAPMSEQTFFANVWEKKVAFFEKSDPSFLKEVFNIEDVDQLLSSYQLKASECRIVKHEEKIQPHEYTIHRGVNRGVMREDFVDKDKMFDFYRKGATIILEGAQFFSPKLAGYCRSLEQEIGCRVHANVYVSPARSQGFPIHFDTHDLLIFQIHGSKRWNFYGSPIGLPLKEQYSSCEPVTAKTAEMLMDQGDVLYLPRGVQHEALTHKEMSIHIALGIYPVLWSDLLGDLVSWTSIQDEEIRKSGPRFIGSRRDLQHSIEQGIHFLDKMKERLVSENFLNHLRLQHVSDHRNVSGGFLSAIEGASSVTADSYLRVREDIIYNYRIENGLLVLTFHKSGIRMNACAYSIIEEMVRSPKFRPKDLAHFQGEDVATALCARLMREGFLRLSNI